MHQTKELLINGLPVGFQWVFEIGFFTVIALLIGSIGPVPLAAHQIAFQTYTLFFLIVYHFNQAVMIRALEGAGAKRSDQIWYSYIGGHSFNDFMLGLANTAYAFFIR